MKSGIKAMIGVIKTIIKFFKVNKSKKNPEILVSITEDTEPRLKIKRHI